MKLYFSQLAQKELQDAVYYYDEIAKELGSSLLNEVNEAGSLIVKFPLAWSKIGKNQRRYLLKRFPYMLIYKVYADRIIIAAIAHQHRMPDYYINRK